MGVISLLKIELLGDILESCILMGVATHCLSKSEYSQLQKDKRILHQTYVPAALITRSG